MSAIKYSFLTKQEDIRYDNSKDTTDILSAKAEAVKYIKSHKRCTEIEEIFLGIELPGILSVFLFQFKELINKTDKYLWVVVGDLPSAYLVIDNAAEPKEALSGYCERFIGIAKRWRTAMKYLKGI